MDNQNYWCSRYSLLNFLGDFSAYEFFFELFRISLESMDLLLSDFSSSMVSGITSLSFTSLSSFSYFFTMVSSYYLDTLLTMPGSPISNTFLPSGSIMGYLISIYFDYDKPDYYSLALLVALLDYL